MKIYTISGLGANEKVFKNLKLNPKIELVHIPWIIPSKDESISAYALRMSESIDDTEPFLLMGLSFGGIMIQEIHKIKKAKALIIISSVTSRKELPLWMLLTSKLNIHKLIPSKFITSEGVLSYAFFRKIYSSKMPSLEEFFNLRDATYLRWSIDKIVNWKGEYLEVDKIQIHGDKDIVFSVDRIKDKEIIKGGSHLMVLLKHSQVSDCINKSILKFI